MTTANDIIARLNLQPHPEGGFFRETFRQQPEGGARGALALIYYLLSRRHTGPPGTGSMQRKYGTLFAVIHFA